MTVKHVYKKLNRRVPEASIFVVRPMIKLLLLNPSYAMRIYKVKKITIDFDIDTNEPMYFLYI